MKMSVCDVCFYQDKKYIPSEWRVGKKEGSLSFRLDVCNKHKFWSKGANSLKELESRYLELVEKVK